MKTKEELNAIKEEIEALSKKLAELNEEELAEVAGGLAPGRKYWPSNIRGKADELKPVAGENGDWINE